MTHPKLLRAAVIGGGHLGRHHVRILSALEGVELRVLAEPKEDLGRELAGKYGCRWVPDRAGLETEVDFAVVAAPTSRHRECARGFLRAGVACLVEKPLAPDPGECRRILEDAKAGGALLGVGHVERFNPAFQRAMQLGIEPRFIEAHRLSPYPFRSTDVGVVLDLMIHDLDLVLAWAGRPLEWIDAVGGTVLSSTEDIVSARLRFQGGLVANLTASRLSLKPMRRFRVFGPDCYVSVDSRQRYALLVTQAPGFTAEALRAAQDAPDPREAFEGLLHTEELTLDEEEPLRAELEAFVSALRTGGPAPVSGEDGFRAVELAHKVLDSMQGSLWNPRQEAFLL